MKQPFAPVVWLSERPPTPTVEAAFTAIGRPLLRGAGPPDPPANAEALRLTATWAAERAQTPSAGHPIVFIREEGAAPSPTRDEALPTPGALLRALSLAHAQAETDLLYGILDRQARAFSANRIAAWRFDFEPPSVESVHLIDGFDTRLETANEEDGVPGMALVHPDDQGSLHQIFEGPHSHEPAVVRVRLRTADGGWGTSELRGRWAPGETPGHPGYIAGVSVDLRAWEQVEEQRRQAERRWEIVGSMRPCFVWEANQHGILTYLSPGVHETLGYRPEELIGRPARGLLADPQAATPFAGIGVAEGAQPRATVNLRAKDGRALRAMVAGRVQPRGAGEGHAFHGAAVVASGALAELDRLEEARARSAAEATATRDFVANLSHEIRTPLTGVVGLSDLLLQAAAPGAQAARLRTLRAQAEGLLETVNDVLDLARLEAGASPLEIAPCSPAAIAQAVLRGRSAALGDPALLWTRLPWAGWQVFADALHLQQLIRHLLVSARQAAPDAPLHLRIGPAERREQSGLQLSLQGEGPRLCLPQLLEREAPTGPIAAGASRQASLSLCRNLLKALCADLKPESGGFSVTLVAERAPEAQAPRAALPGPLLLVAPPGRDRARLTAQLDMMDVPIVVFDHPSEVELHAEGMAGAFGAAIVGAVLDPAAPEGQADAGIALLEQLRDHGAVGAGPLLLWPRPRAAVADDLPQGILALPWPPRAEALWTALHPNEGPGARPTVASLPGRTALLVEDHPVNQEVLRSLLDRLGVLVEIAADGQAALSALAARRYDVVLMDCHLPVLDGLSATRRHRATERQRRAPRQLILAMTASELEADRRACAEAGMDGYLVKPIRLQTLREALEGAVGAQERAEP